nr:hypothetical protein K-LCC10_0488 [Kaumoebavirus]
MDYTAIAAFATLFTVFGLICAFFVKQMRKPAPAPIVLYYYSATPPSREFCERMIQEFRVKQNVPTQEILLECRELDQYQPTA